MNEAQILNSVISGLMEIPLPKDGKTIGIGQFKRDIEKAYKLARLVQWSDNITDMRNTYAEFRKHVDYCIDNGR
jgi:hypothetical protein